MDVLGVSEKGFTTIFKDILVYFFYLKPLCLESVCVQLCVIFGFYSLSFKQPNVRRAEATSL